MNANKAQQAIQTYRNLRLALMGRDDGLFSISAGVRPHPVALNGLAFKLIRVAQQEALPPTMRTWALYASARLTKAVFQDRCHQAKAIEEAGYAMLHGARLM